MIDVDKCPRDQEVDTWFDEEFERQKTRGDKTAPVLKDETPPEPEDLSIDAMISDMMEELP